MAALGGLVLLGAYAVFAPATYSATARIVIEPMPGAAASLPGPPESAKRLKQAAFDPILLGELGHELGVSEPADKVKQRVEGMLSVVPAGTGAFDFVLLDSKATRARDICNSLARRAAGRASSALVGEPVDADAKRKELEQRRKAELEAFIAAHPELASPVVAPVTSSAPKGPSEIQLSSLRAERDKIEAKIAQSDARSSDNPYDESGVNLTQLRQRLREIDSILNPKKAAPKEKPAPKIEPEVEREWKRLLAAAAEAAPAPAAAPPIKVRLAEAPLPTWPLEAKQRFYLLLLGLVGCVAYLLFRSRASGGGPSSGRVRTDPFPYAGTQPALSPRPPSDPPHFGREPQQFGSYPPGGGSEPPRVGSEPPRVGSEPPRVGSEPPRVGSEPPRVGSDPPYGGSEPPRAGSEPPRPASDTPRAGSDPPRPGSDRPIYGGSAAQRADETPRVGSDAPPIAPHRMVSAAEPYAPPVVPLPRVEVGAEPIQPSPTRDALPGSRTISSAPPPAAAPRRAATRPHPASTLSGFAPMPIVPAPIHTPYPPAPDLTPAAPPVLEPFDTSGYVDGAAAPEAREPEVHQAIVMTVPPPAPDQPLDPVSVPRHNVRSSGSPLSDTAPREVPSARKERPGAERRHTAAGPFTPGSEPPKQEESRPPRGRLRPGRITQTLGSPITPEMRSRPSVPPASVPPPQTDRMAHAKPTPTGYSYVNTPATRTSMPPRHLSTPPHYGQPSHDRPKYPSTPHPVAPAPAAPQAERPKVRIRPVHAGWSPDPSLRFEQRRPLADELFPLAVDRCLVIGVSAVPEARHQKTRVASEIALALAEPRHQRVLLVEGDFQWPAVHELMRIEMPFSAGFSQQLRARAQSEAHVWTVVQCAPALHVIAEGIMRSPGLILSSHFEESLRSFRSAYDIVVVDGPLASLEVDSRAFDSVVDGLVLVSPAAGSSWLQSANMLFSEKRFSRVVSVEG